MSGGRALLLLPFCPLSWRHNAEALSVGGLARMHPGWTNSQGVSAFHAAPLRVNYGASSLEFEVFGISCH